MTAGTPTGAVAKRLWILIIAAIVLAVVVGLLISRDPHCSDGSVLHPAAGTCINPNALVITDAVEEDLAAALSAYGGEILYSVYDSWYVRVPAGSLEELDILKANLEAGGFDVDYAIVGQFSE